MPSVALHYMYYNFVRIHKTLRCAPAKTAGVTSVFALLRIFCLLDEAKA